MKFYTFARVKVSGILGVACSPMSVPSTRKMVLQYVMIVVKSCSLRELLSYIGTLVEFTTLGFQRLTFNSSKRRTRKARRRRTTTRRSEFFKKKSVHLCTDCLTGQSLCYAYVNFFSHYDASKAMYYLNHSYLNGKPMRIMWSQRNPVVRKTGIGNLFVKNLHISVDSVVLESWFQNFGKVLSCKVVEENGISKGFGFVQFDSEESAMRALDALDGTILLGKKICVAKFIRKSERQPVSMDLIYTNVYVNNLDENITEDFLRNRFSEYGKVVSVAIKKDIQGKSKGFGFICFESLEDANKAVAALNGAQIGSKKIFAGKAQKKAERQKMLKQQREDEHLKKWEKFRDSTYKRQPVSKECNFTNVYVNNLENDVTEDFLQNKFSEYSLVKSVAIMRDDQGESKGFGFVSFESPEDANRAILAMNGAQLGKKKIFAGKAKKPVGKQLVRQKEYVFDKKLEKFKDLKLGMPQESKEYNSTNVFVNNLEQDITEEFLRNKFSAYAKVCNVAIMKDDEGKSKGFGFISFESPEDAEKAIVSMNGAQLGSKNIFVGKAQKKVERKQLLRLGHNNVHDRQLVRFKGSTVYVENLNESIDDMVLRDIFTECGQIISAKVMRYEDGRSKGFGFVCFYSPSEANKATTLHRTIVRGRSLYVSMAQDQENVHVMPQYSHPGYNSISFCLPTFISDHSNTYMHLGINDYACCSAITPFYQRSYHTTFSEKQSQMKTTNWLKGLPLYYNLPVARNQGSDARTKSFKWVQQKQCMGLEGAAPSKLKQVFYKKATMKSLCREPSRNESEFVQPIAAAAAAASTLLKPTNDSVPSVSC